MKKTMVLLLVFTAAFCTLSWGLEVFTPVLNSGDWWEIEVIQKNVFNNVKKWSSPFVLKYTVSKADTEKYTIDITEAKDGNQVGQLIILKAGFKLETVYYYRRVQGEVLRQRIDFDRKTKAPVISEVSFIPYSLPVFPLKKGSSNSENLLESVPQKEKFLSMKTSSGDKFKFRRSFSQQTVNSTVLTTLESAEAIELIEEVGEAKLADGYYVTVKDSFLGEKIEQLWKKGYPWFLYSKNSNLKAKLIKHSSAANGGEK